MNKLTKIFRGQTVELGLDNKVMGVHAQDIVDAATDDGFSVRWDFGQQISVSESKINGVTYENTKDVVIYVAAALGVAAFCLFSLLGWVK